MDFASIFMLYIALCIFIAISVFLILIFVSRRKQGKSITSLAIPLVFALLLFGFVVAFVAVTSVKISEVGTSEFFIEEGVPYPYWIGVILVAGSTTVLLLFYEKKNPVILVVLALALLVVSMRMIFPGIFVSVTSYEPDSYYYMSVVDSWTRTGIDFGVEGMYQHDYPVSFIIAYIFAKVGVPVEIFFRWAPSFVYALDVLLLYLLYKEVFPKGGEKNYVPMALVLFSLSTGKYFATIHWCPALAGATLFILSLYLSIRFAKKGEWNLKAMLPVFALILVLVLSHHLSVLYFVIALLGLAVSTRFFKIPEVHGAGLSFFILAVYTYTLWFGYGSYVYPKFFNSYALLNPSLGSTVIQLANESFLDQLTLIVQPVFVSVLFVWGVLRSFGANKFSDLVHVLRKLARKDLSLQENDRMQIVFASGFFLTFLALLAGFFVPTLLPVRILEIVLVGMYPVVSQTLIHFCCGHSNKRRILLFFFLVFMILVSTHRYSRGQQMRLLE